MTGIKALVLTACCVICLDAQAQQNDGQAAEVTVDPDGTVHVPAYEVPLSIYMSDEAKRAYIDESLHTPKREPSDDIATERESIDRVLLKPLLDKARAAYAVTIEEKRIGGVQVQVILPAEGVAKQNKDRILINLHGGGLRVGAGALQLIESIPIVGTAKIEVISVGYRLRPEYKFPAACEDIAAVYRELLKRYEPRNIGIYGSSAGGALAAMSVAWFQKEGLPRPGAIGLLSPGSAVSGGDSRYTAAPLNPLFGGNKPAPPATPNPPPIGMEPYFLGADLRDPLISPMLHPKVLARFPPSLLITGTRDFLASSVIHTHRQLVRAGVDAELQVWEGMWHAFYQDVSIPESKEVYEVMAKFFATHLGQSH